MVILPIYGSRAILLLFFYHLEYESESQEIDIMQLDQYSTRKISMTLWDNDLHITHDGRNYCSVIHIYGDRAIFLLLYDHQDTIYE